MAVTKRKRVGRAAYQAEVFVAGVRVAFDCFDTRSAAHAWHDATKKRIEFGEATASNLTLGEVISEYRVRVFPSYVESSRASTNVRLKFLEEAPAASLKVRDFSATTIDRLLDWMCGASGRAKNPNRLSFRKDLRMLGTVLMFYREHFDERFVSPILKRHQLKANFRGKPVNRRGRNFFLQPEQAKRWFAELAIQNDPVYAALARFQVIMGVRVGEAAALCWDAVDLEAGTVEIRRTMEWARGNGTTCKRVRDRTKTESSRRTLPLPVQIVSLLREQRDRGPAVLTRGDEGGMLHAVFGTKRASLLFYETIRVAYNRGFVKAGLPWTASHICRHTNGTLGVRSSRAEAVQLSLGHSSVRQTEVYARARAMVENTVPANVAQLLE